MKAGDVVYTRSITAHFGNDIVRGSSTWKADKGRFLVVLVLGSTAAPDDFDPVAALMAHGWTPPPGLAPSTPDKAPADVG